MAEQYGFWEKEFWSDPFGQSFQWIGDQIDALTGRAQIKLNEENLAYQQQYNQQIFDREDNAQQRAVTDLMKAGLHPSLAAGKGARAGGSAVVPQKSPSGLERKQDFMLKALNVPIQIAMAVTEMDSILAQTEKTRQEASLISGTKDLKIDRLVMENDVFRKTLNDVVQLAKNKTDISQIEKELQRIKSETSARDSAMAEALFKAIGGKVTDTESKYQAWFPVDQLTNVDNDLKDIKNPLVLEYISYKLMAELQLKDFNFQTALGGKTGSTMLYGVLNTILRGASNMLPSWSFNRRQ